MDRKIYVNLVKRLLGSDDDVDLVAVKSAWKHGVPPEDCAAIIRRIHRHADKMMDLYNKLGEG